MQLTGRKQTEASSLCLFTKPTETAGAGGIAGGLTVLERRFSGWTKTAQVGVSE